MHCLKHKGVLNNYQLSCFTVNVAFVPVDKVNVTASAEDKAISITSPAVKLKITLPSNKLSTPSDKVLVLVVDAIGTLLRRIAKVNATATDAVDTNFQLISYIPVLATVIALAATVVFNNGMVLLKATCCVDAIPIDIGVVVVLYIPPYAAIPPAAPVGPVEPWIIRKPTIN